MDQVRNFTQAYSQAPWRKQLQGIGVFMTILAVLLLAASVYISVTARTATVGKDIQRYRLQAESLELEIANMRTHLADLTSVATMKKRAIDLGFRQATQEDIIYVKVPGYFGNTVIDLAPVPQIVEVAKPELSPAYTQSWVEWFARQFRAPIVPLAELQP